MHENTCAILAIMRYRVILFNVKIYRMKYFRHENLMFVIYGNYYAHNKLALRREYLREQSHLYGFVVTIM